jgi:dTDP-4-amino-4,6-dideoxygalactose transaminase
MEVPYVDIAGQYRAQQADLTKVFDEFMSRGQYILGDQVAKFEQQFGALCEVKHAIGVANGTDAIILALKALGVGQGDEVITPPNSWVSSTSAIALVGATPVFVDVDSDQNIDPKRIDQAVSKKTRAIIAVHLTGKTAKMNAILEIATQRGIKVIEDSAQAVGSRYCGQMSGSMGDIGCFSLHPLKNLNAAGDAGIVTTNQDDLAEKLRLLRNHGLVARNEIRVWGYNSRLDGLQAAILSYRLAHLNDIIAARRQFAELYRENLRDIGEDIGLPKEEPGCFDTNHLFVIQVNDRDRLKNYLKDHRISTAIHYPIPIHMQPACRYLNYSRGDFPIAERQADRILSLPIHQMLSKNQVTYVSEKIRDFFSV